MAEVDAAQSAGRIILRSLRGKIVEAGPGFAALTGFETNAVLGMEAADMFRSLLKLSDNTFNTLTAKGSASGYIFSASGQARNVLISLERHGDEALFSLAALPDAPMDYIHFINQLFMDESRNIAMYSVPDYVILKANENFRKFVRQTFGINGNVDGLSVRMDIPGAMPLVEMLDATVAGGTMINVEENEILGVAGQPKYCRCSFMPICADGVVQYILEISIDMTVPVHARRFLEKQTADLRLQKEKLETLIGNIADPLLFIGKNGYYETMNKAARDIFGRGSSLEKVGDIHKSGVYTDFSDKMIPFDGGPGFRVMRGEALRHYQLKTHQDDQDYYFDVNGTPIFDETGQVLNGVLFFRDISEHFRNQKENAEKNKLLSAVLENMHDALIVFTGDGYISYINAKARELYPHFTAETTILTVHDGFICTDREGCIIPEELLPTRRVMRGERVRNEYIGASGKDWKKYFEINATPLFDEDGRLVSAVVIHHDVTEPAEYRRRIQMQNEQLREKNKILARQAKLLDISNEAIFAWEQTGKIIYWNKGAERMYGYTSAEAVGHYSAPLLKTFIIEDKVFSPEHSDEDDDWCGILEHTTKGGETIVVESRLQVISDENNEKIILETNRDVTERRKIENALRESELSYRMASEGSGAGVFAYDFIRKKCYWSAQYRNIVGLSPDAPMQTEWDFELTLVHPEDRERLAELTKAAYEPAGDGIFQHEYRVIRPDGSIRWLFARGQTFFTGQGSEKHPYLSAGSVLDITENKLAELKVTRISEELTNIIESTDDFIWSVDKNRRIVFCNTAARKHFRDYYGRDVDDIDAVMDLMPQRMAVSFGEHQEYADSRIQFEIRTPLGGRVVSYSVNPVYIGGVFVEVTVFGRDITERLNTEREIIRLNASLEERVAERTIQLQQSVSDLKNISLVLSHDLKTAMRGISLYASEILEGITVPENAKKIKKINRDLVAMVDGLMNYEKSSRSTMTKESVNIKKLIVSVFSELNAASDVKGHLEFETGLPYVHADRELLRHVVMNILTNALKFIFPGRPLKIDVGCRAEENFYTIYFRDNGIGFDNAYSEKIFGVFERLHSKGEYEGSGVGLAIVRNIIQNHGGRVWADSVAGIGTTIYLSLPILT